MKAQLTIALILLSVSLSTKAQLSWLPQPVELASAQQLAKRMIEAGFASGSVEENIEGTVNLIRAMGQQIEALGSDGLLELAPDFEELTLPTQKDPYLDAMGRYGVCNLTLFLQHIEREQRDKNARFTAATGLSAIALSMIYLRNPYIVAGGPPETVQAWLTSSEFEPSYQAIQSNAELRTYVENECSQPVIKMLDFMWAEEKS